MKLPGAIKKGLADLDAAVARNNGEFVSILPLEYDKIVSASIVNPFKLPVEIRSVTNSLTNGSNQNVFLMDYSNMDSTHVMS